MAIVNPDAGRRPPARGRPGGADGGDEGVESNARLTASTAAVLLVLLAAEGATILSIRSLLSPHVFIGMLLVPPVLLKIGSTAYRFVRYYRGSPAYRRKGPPPVVLRLLGPFVVATTVVVLASGIALLLVPRSLRQSMLLLHKASFILWFGAMAIHVVGHLLETTRLAPRDWVRGTRPDVKRAGLRQWAVVVSVALGVPLGLLLLGRVGPWVSHERPSINAEHGTPGRSRVEPTTHTTSASPASTAVPAATGPHSHLKVPAPFMAPSVAAGSVPKPVPAGPSARHQRKSRLHHHGSKKAKHAG